MIRKRAQERGNDRTVGKTDDSLGETKENVPRIEEMKGNSEGIT